MLRTSRRVRQGPPWTANDNVGRNIHEARQLWFNRSSTQTVTTLTGFISGNARCFGNVTGGDGKMYYVPFSRTAMATYDPATDTFVFPQGNTLPAGAGMRGGCLAPNGKIFCLPTSTVYEALEYDPVTDTSTLFGAGQYPAISSGWQCPVVGPDGMVYGLPLSTNTILKIDPNTRAITTFGDTGSNRYYASVVGVDGKIYGIPNNTTKVLVLDVTVSPPTIEFFDAVQLGYNSGCVGPDGLIYALPQGTNQMMWIDPVARTSGLFGSTIASGAYRGCKLAADGKIYHTPHAATQVMVVDPIARTTTVFGTTFSTANKWRGAAMGREGAVYGSPYDSQSSFSLLRVPTVSVDLPQNIYASRYFGGL